MDIRLKILGASLCLLLAGCSLGHKQFYTQVAPIKYQPTGNVLVFEYQNVKLRDLYDIIFTDYLVIGESSFNGPYENPEDSESFAKSIGTDVLITSIQYAGTRTSFANFTSPSSSTTTFSGYSGSNSFSGTATTFGTKTTTVPVTVDRYDQDGMFLRNVNKVIPIWEKHKGDYIKSGESKYDGLWFNDKYEIYIYISGNNIVGVISKLFDSSPKWKAEELKLIFNSETSTGIYFMGDRTPMPAGISINKFNHLEIVLWTTKEHFAFARK